MEGLESMSTEVAGPMTTHPQLLPEEGHSSVGGHGILGSASSSLVGVSTLWYPSGLADPLDSSIASEGQITAESTITTATATTGSQPVTSRQPPPPRRGDGCRLFKSYNIHNSTVVGLFMTPDSMGADSVASWLSAHCSWQHCLRLNLQLHTISLVRTCRISSFCTVAWQLARLLLTRRIARSLGDS